MFVNGTKIEFPWRKILLANCFGTFFAYRTDITNCSSNIILHT